MWNKLWIFRIVKTTPDGHLLSLVTVRAQPKSIQVLPHYHPLSYGTQLWIRQSIDVSWKRLIHRFDAIGIAIVYRRKWLTVLQSCNESGILSVFTADCGVVLCNVVAILTIPRKLKERNRNGSSWWADGQYPPNLFKVHFSSTLFIRGEPRIFLRRGPGRPPVSCALAYTYR